MIQWSFPETPLAILAVIVGAFIVRLIIVRMIKVGTKQSKAKAERRRQRKEGRTASVLHLNHAESDDRHDKRRASLGALLNSIVTFVVATVALATIAALLGIPLTPLIAASGVGGVALGIGAQSIVKDFLAGIAIIIEDQYGVGDIIDTGDVAGTVEDISLRVTRLRDASGEVWYVRNGEILRVGNVSQGWSTAMVDVPMHPGTDGDAAIEILKGVVADFWKDPDWKPALVERPQVAGVNQVTGVAMKVLITAKTHPNEHWKVQRELLSRSVAALHAAGIDGPLPSVLAE
ncbi:MAG: mechanosensitive ion channel family protein [Propionibacteriaceae bacterium]|jgi:small conductance mechanosensitive channel|nr:mechanosensitive ion channel family protein [Propionibacteriaceae bacterium]